MKKVVIPKEKNKDIRLNISISSNFKNRFQKQSLKMVKMFL